MSPSFASTILSGCAILLAALFLALWQIFSAPDRPNYPTSGPIKRAIMFWFAAGLLYRGAEVLILASAAKPVFSTAGQVATSMLLSAFFGVMLVDHMRHWLPARTWQRIQQLMAIARCRPRQDVINARTSAMVNSTGKPCPSADVVGPALAELHLQGVPVAGPMEGPEAFVPH